MTDLPKLRSSAIPEDGRHPIAQLAWGVTEHLLRSSAIPEDGRHDPAELISSGIDIALRSSAIPEDGRHFTYADWVSKLNALLL